MSKVLYIKANAKKREHQELLEFLIVLLKNIRNLIQMMKL